MTSLLRTRWSIIMTGLVIIGLTGVKKKSYTLVKWLNDSDIIIIWKIGSVHVDLPS